MLEPEEKLTIQTLKKFKGFENVTNEEASNIIYTIEQFSKVVYEMYLKSLQHKNK
jgi:hypothetical protein